MKRNWTLAALAVLLFSSVASAQTYWVIENTTDQLCRVDVTTQVGTVVGSLGVDWGFGGLGFSSNGTLYGWNTGNNGLYTINTTTGAATLVGTGSLGGMDSFDINPVNGRAFGVEVGGNSVQEVNLATGAQTFVASTSPSQFIAASAFSPGGTWYGWLVGSPLFIIDPLTGVVTTVGATGLSGVHTNLGFNQADGQLYSIAISDANFPLFSIDPTTAAATFIGNVSGLPGGSSQQITAGTFQFAAVPEPTTFALLGLAAAGSGGSLWWRRNKALTARKSCR